VHNYGTMSDDQFTKLFKYMQENFAQVRAEMNTEFTKVREDIDLLYRLVDADLKQRETDEQERLIMGHQLTRHEQWFDQLAKKTKTRLLPER
jgi:hypothetical protein